MKILSGEKRESEMNVPIVCIYKDVCAGEFERTEKCWAWNMMGGWETVKYDWDSHKCFSSVLMPRRLEEKSGYPRIPIVRYHTMERVRERENVCKDRTFKIQQAFPVMHTSIYLFVKLDILTFFFVVDDAVVKCIYAVILIPYVGYEIYLWKTSWCSQFFSLFSACALSRNLNIFFSFWGSSMSLAILFI